MGFNSLFAANAISGSGMSAERFRMEVIANNVANANSTRSANGGPFRRQDVVFAEVLGGRLRPDGAPTLGGVVATGSLLFAGGAVVIAVGIEERSSDLHLVDAPGMQTAVLPDGLSVLRTLDASVLPSAAGWTALPTPRSECRRRG